MLLFQKTIWCVSCTIWDCNQLLSWRRAWQTELSSSLGLTVKKSCNQVVYGNIGGRVTAVTYHSPASNVNHCDQHVFFDLI